jgi:RNA-binding protein NOB1
VLMQMGLHVVSVEGRRVSQLKNWVLRCHACYTVTRQMDRRFCDKCGGPTLIRTSMSVDPVTGRMTLYLKRNFQYRVRGTKYSIPSVKGGREANLILREDQKEYVRAAFHEKKLKEKADAAANLDGGYEFGSAASRQPHSSVTIGFGRKNPNEAKRRLGKKKSQAYSA